MAAMKNHQQWQPIHSLLLALSFTVYVTLTFAQSESDSGLSLAKQARQMATKQKFNSAIELSISALKLMQNKPQQNQIYIPYVLDDIATFYYRQVNLELALKYALKAQNAIEKLPDTVPEKNLAMAHIINNRATLLLSTGNFSEAKKGYLKSLSIYQKAPEQFWNEIAKTGNNLAALYNEQGHFDTSIDYIHTSLSLLEKYGGHKNKVDIFQQYLRLARTELRAENPKKAKQLIKKASLLGQNSKKLHPDLWLDYQLTLAKIQIYQSALPDAKLTLDESLLLAKSVGDNQAAANLSYSLGTVYILQGKMVEAEPAFKSALSLFRKQVGAGHPTIAKTLHALAIVNKSLGHYELAESYYQQALVIFSQSLGDNQPPVAATKLEYSLLLSRTHRVFEAKSMATEAIIFYSEGNKYPLQLGYAQSALGFALFEAGQLPEAKISFNSALNNIASVRGENSADLPPGLIKLAEIAIKQGDSDVAEQSLERAITILRSTEAESPYGLVKALSVKSKLLIQQKKVLPALQTADQYMKIMAKRLAINQNMMINTALEEQREVRGLFQQYLSTGLLVDQRMPTKELKNKLFKTAQYPHMTSTASALTNMAARFSSEENSLGKLLRQRDLLLEQWKQSERAFIRHLTINSIQAVTHRAPHVSSAEIEHQIRQLDSTLKQQFPQLSELINPIVVELETIQSLLNEKEVLFVQITGTEGTHLVLVTPQKIHFKQSSLTSKQLEALVRNLRETIDLTRIGGDIKNLPTFDVLSAHFLYQQLLQPLEEYLQDSSHIIAVLDGGMQNFPLSLLVTKPYSKPIQKPEDHKNVSFLGHQYATSVIPSVSSLVALRAWAKDSKATKPFIGIGDPDLEPGIAVTRNNTQDSQALSKQLFQQNNPNVIRSFFFALPDTRIELKALAKSTGAKPSDLYFRERATETITKQLTLDQYKIIAFATHGLLSGEFKGLLEPALVMTPPTSITAIDNGLLMASEIANLSLDADWVILSACNTASPAGRPGAEGLSGLAKSFLYAGTRSLLVSHWSIDSKASALLTMNTLEFLAQADSSTTKAEALKQAMIKVANHPTQTHFAHPAFWAPFIIVGEGS